LGLDPFGGGYFTIVTQKDGNLRLIRIYSGGWDNHGISVQDEVFFFREKGKDSRAIRGGVWDW